MEISIFSAASSFAERGTVHSKRFHDDICVGALIIAENGISKKRRLAPKLEVANAMRAENCFEQKKKVSANEDTLLNWRRNPQVLSSSERKKCLECINAMWYKHPCATPEHAKTVRIDETRNGVVRIPNLLSFVHLHENSIARKAKILGGKKNALIGFARQKGYAMMWSALQQRVFFLEKEKEKWRMVSKCALKTLAEELVETDEVETSESSTAVSSKTVATATDQLTLEPTEEEVQADVGFDGELVCDEELHVPSATPDTGNQFFTSSQVVEKPTAGSNFNVDRAKTQEQQRLEADAEANAEADAEINVEANATAEVEVETEVEMKAEAVVFEADVEPLVKAETAVSTFEKEVASTLDGRYWAAMESRLGRKRKKTVFFSPC